MIVVAKGSAIAKTYWLIKDLDARLLSSLEESSVSEKALRKEAGLILFLKIIQQLD